MSYEISGFFGDGEYQDDFPGAGGDDFPSGNESDFGPVFLPNDEFGPSPSDFGPEEFAPSGNGEPTYQDQDQEFSPIQPYAPQYPSYGPGQGQGNEIPQYYDPFAAQQQGYSPYGQQGYYPQGYQQPYTDPCSSYQGYTYRRQGTAIVPAEQSAGCMVVQTPVPHIECPTNMYISNVGIPAAEPCPYGAQQQMYDPYGNPIGAAGQAFPAGTPQSVIDASNAIAMGTATLAQIQQAVAALTAMGQTQAAATLMQQYQAMVAATGGVTGAAGSGTETCTQKFNRLSKSNTITVKMIDAIKKKQKMTTAQIATMRSLLVIANCAVREGSKPAQAFVTLTKTAVSTPTSTGARAGTVLTQEQKDAGCKLVQSRKGTQIICPGGTTKPDVGAAAYAAKGTTLRTIGRVVYSSIRAALLKKCSQDQGTPNKCEYTKKEGIGKKGGWAYSSYIRAWDAMNTKSATLPTDPIDATGAATILANLASAKNAIANSTATKGFDKELNALMDVLRKYKINVSV